jgi:hypothetical protein
MRLDGYGKRIPPREVYHQIAQQGYDVVIDVLEEGEAKYPNTDIAAIVNKTDHLAHAYEHYQRFIEGDTSERHLEHCITRLVLEWIRRHPTCK